MAKEKYISEAPIKDTPKKVINLYLKDGIITTNKLKDGAVTEDKISDSFKERLTHAETQAEAAQKAAAEAKALQAERTEEVKDLQENALTNVSFTQSSTTAALVPQTADRQKDAVLLPMAGALEEDGKAGIITALDYTTFSGGAKTASDLKRRVGRYREGDDDSSSYGLATLDATGKVVSTQLPSYVDDILEGYVSSDVLHFYQTQEAAATNDGSTALITNESGDTVDRMTGVIYVDLITNKTYRWSGTQYTEVGQSIGIGTTTGTAFDGARGRAIEKVLVREFSQGNLKVTPSIIEKGVDTQITINYNYQYAGESVTPDEVALSDSISGDLANTSFSADRVTPTETGWLYTINDSDTFTLHVTYNGFSVPRNSATGTVASVNAYYRIYYGFDSAQTIINESTGEIDMTNLTAAASIKSSPAGSYNNIVHDADGYFYLAVPATMKVSKITSGGFDVPFISVTHTTGNTSTNGTINNIPYALYRSEEEMNAGTFSCIVS